jgi:hypothetical protein
MLLSNRSEDPASLLNLDDSSAAQPILAGGTDKSSELSDSRDLPFTSSYSANTVATSYWKLPRTYHRRIEAVLARAFACPPHEYREARRSCLNLFGEFHREHRESAAKEDKPSSFFTVLPKVEGQVWVLVTYLVCDTFDEYQETGATRDTAIDPCLEGLETTKGSRTLFFRLC